MLLIGYIEDVNSIVMLLLEVFGRPLRVDWKVGCMSGYDPNIYWRLV